MLTHDILKDFLKTHRSEVTKNMQLNYKFDRQLELERADAHEEGLEEGRKLGQKIGQEEGRKEGREEGRKEGREETLNLINKLNDILLSEGRVEDLKRSINDREYQAQLLKEYRL